MAGADRVERRTAFRLHRRTDKRQRAALDAVRPAVVREWANARRIEAEQKLYHSLRERYEITVEAAPHPAPTARRDAAGFSLL